MQLSWSKTWIAGQAGNDDSAYHRQRVSPLARPRVSEFAAGASAPEFTASEFNTAATAACRTSVIGTFPALGIGGNGDGLSLCAGHGSVVVSAAAVS